LAIGKFKSLFLYRVRTIELKNKNTILLFVVSSMIVCTLPLMLFSEHRQSFFASFINGTTLSEQKTLAAISIVGLFASDIFLPIPSTAVCAVAGQIFGVPIGTLLCWFGLNLSAAIGYFLGYTLGWQAVRTFSDESDAIIVKDQIGRWGIWPLIIFRPIPVLSEASILMMGAYRYPVAKFWPPVLATNFLVSFCFVLLGRWFSDQGQFWIGVLVACGIPIILLAVWTIVSARRK